MTQPDPVSANRPSLDQASTEALSDARPLYRVAIFGLAHRFQRLMEIVLRHARHNQYRYVLAQSRGPGEYDIALVDMTAKGGPEVASTLRRLPGARPVVRVGRRTDEARGPDDLLQSSFTMNLLKTLNRVVEEALLGRPSPRPGLWSPTSPLPRWAGEEPARVLIVDDSPTVRRQLAVALRQMGLDSEGVGSAREALDKLGARRYDLAFVDVVMPEMDGYRLTREIKRTRGMRATPVIILTSRSSPFDLARGALAGCNSYLVKPVSLNSLRETVARHLRKRSGPEPGAGRLSPA